MTYGLQAKRVTIFTYIFTKQKEGLAENGQPLEFYGSPGRTRTADKVVNSHPLYQLSYRGMSGAMRMVWLGD